MVRHFDTELKDLRDGLMAMAGQVEEMIDLSRAAVSEGSAAKADRVTELDRKVDEQELKLDQACIDLLALRSPIATDLRLIASSLMLFGFGFLSQNLSRWAALAAWTAVYFGYSRSSHNEMQELHRALSGASGFVYPLIAAALWWRSVGVR